MQDYQRPSRLSVLTELGDVGDWVGVVVVVEGGVNGSPNRLAFSHFID